MKLRQFCLSVFFFSFIFPNLAWAATPTVSSAKITGANQITVVYSELVNSTTVDYTNISANNVSRSVTGISGSGSATILLNFDGAGAGTSATGTMDILGTITSVSTSDSIV